MANYSAQILALCSFYFILCFIFFSVGLADTSDLLCVSSVIDLWFFRSMPLFFHFYF